MSNFELLHPALQHHVVNSLGWKALRPFQDEVIPIVLAGNNTLVIAPTAGGKTEAAILPVMSRILAEGWSGLSVLYICPIKALLNNLHERLRYYAGLVGRSVGVWHGDVTQGEKAKIGRDLPDILLTTPESLEVILTSTSRDKAVFFAGIQVAIIDEIHAFAGDDRGWHLLCLLERISRIAGRDVQRIGLSATLGNPEGLSTWLQGSSKRARACYAPAIGKAMDSPEVKVDYVGTVENAALVISRLHRGEKRLVFLDSRAKAESLASCLRDAGIEAYLSHSSLSLESRRSAEEAFASRSDCVIVATSTLELGIDVGELDRVIQVDAPRSVASFLQRMGRTGRRPGKSRNCLFLATSDAALLHSAAIISLWETGFVEAVVPPPRPWHVVAQQLMALALQQRGIGRAEWRTWLAGVEGLLPKEGAGADALVDHMLRESIFFEEDGLLWFGEKGEKLFGRKNFLELLAVFTTSPMLVVRHGSSEIGSIDPLSLSSRQEGEQLLCLGGRVWRPKDVDWRARVVQVEPAAGKGQSRWQGLAPDLSFALAQCVKRILVSEDAHPGWSQRAVARIQEVRGESPWLSAVDATYLEASEDKVVWHTFAGTRANRLLLLTLKRHFPQVAGDADGMVISLQVPWGTTESASRIREALADAAEPEATTDLLEIAAAGLKFADALPPELLAAEATARMIDTQGAAVVRGQGVLPLMAVKEG